MLRNTASEGDLQPHAGLHQKRARTIGHKRRRSGCAPGAKVSAPATLIIRQAARHRILRGRANLMQVKTYIDRGTMSRAAARHAARLLGEAVERKGHARIVAATGASQIEFLDALVGMPGIRWNLVEMFHLDEYVGLPVTHPASFRRYLLDRLIRPTGIGGYHLLDGERDPHRVADEANRTIASGPIDVAFVGIGENGHLAFNDPPADFETHRPFIVVNLDDACRRQQVGEGWFASLEEVPTRAISMSVRQILKAQVILCIVPDARKAAAVRASVEGDVSPMVPASILRTHRDTTLYLDTASADALAPATRGDILEDDRA
jgi:glucosamine-6-phosphate deaminase